MPLCVMPRFLCSPHNAHETNAWLHCQRLIGGIHVRDEKIGDWLTELASESSAPGGGAAAALNAAVGAALISMVCNLTIGRPRYAEHDESNKHALDAAEALRGVALL